MTAGVHDVLVKARDLISDPERWTKGVDARDARGNVVHLGDDKACQWCLEAAVELVAGDLCALTAHEAMQALRRSAGKRPAFVNDDPATTHADVLALFDRAIEATKP